MTRGTPLRPVLAALLALALLAGLSPSAGAVLGPEARTDTVALTQSVATVDSIATLDGASHRFGFSLGSVLAQATAIQKVITNAGGTVQPAGTTTATVA